jgi:hypothetical protein
LQGVTGVTGIQGPQGVTGLIGPTGPQGTFTGTITFTEGIPIPSSSNIDNHILSGGTFFQITGTTSSNITGFTGGTSGRFLILLNNTTINQTFQQENIASDPSNRLVLGVSNKSIGVNGTMSFIYGSGLTIGSTGGQSRWVMTSST